MEVIKKVDNNVLNIEIIGRLDSSTSNEVENKIFDNDISGYEKIVVDLNKTEYISSAGLRIILKIKKANKNLFVINASLEIYDVFEMTGFTELINISKAYKQMNLDNCPIIGAGAKGIVYKYNGDTAVKVYKNPDSLAIIQNERNLAKEAFILGIPTAISYEIVKVGDKYASVFELIDAKSYSQCIKENPEKIDFYCQEYVKLLKLIHSTKVDTNKLPNIKNKILKWVDTVKNILPKEKIEKLNRLINEVEDTPYMIHFDYHTNNVMYQNNETILIDMDTLSYGNKLFELANIYTCYYGFEVLSKENVEGFIGFDMDTCHKFFDLFINYYFDDRNEKYINKYLDKIRLLSYLRVLNHIIKRNLEEEYKDSYNNSIKLVNEYLDKVDSLKD